MSCSKHKQRRRTGCPDCFPKEKVQTSREALAELSSMEKEVDEMVIKQTRTKKHVVKTVITEEDIEKPSEAVQHLAKQFGVARKELDDLVDAFYHAKIADIDKYFEEKLKEFKQKISSLSTPRYENLYVPLDQFTLKVMDKLNKEKWRLINFWDTNIAKASGIKKEVAVLERLVSPDNKPRPEFKI